MGRARRLPCTPAPLCDGLDILATDVDPAMLRRAPGVERIRRRMTFERFARVTPRLVIGTHEALPDGQRLFTPVARCVFQTLAW